MPKIFVSYRRDDSADAAGRLHDRLSAEFGKASVFIDVDNIPFGVDFRKHLADAVGNCDVLLAIMGNEWLEAQDREGKRRLDDEADFVRIEIATALQRQIPVIPILVGDNSVPKPDQLPDDLRELAFRNAAEIRAGAHFSSQVDKLVQSIRVTEVRKSPKPPTLVAKRAPVAEPKPPPKPTQTPMTATAPVAKAAVIAPRKRPLRAKLARAAGSESLPFWRMAFLLYAPRTTASLLLRLAFFPSFAMATIMAFVTLMLKDSDGHYNIFVKLFVIAFYYGCVYVPFWLPAIVLDLLEKEAADRREE